MCTEKERLRKKLLAQHKDTCIELFKEIANSQVKRSAKSQSGCGLQCCFMQNKQLFSGLALSKRIGRLE